MHYAQDDEFKRVDAFICSYPVANCELFVPFNKVQAPSDSSVTAQLTRRVYVCTCDMWIVQSLIVHATTRLEVRACAHDVTTTRLSRTTHHS